MTFEEFFTKKKIDLVQLEQAEPALYSEFKSHFSAMGEKSFDHTKKFWFNKLRRLYHLSTPAKAITQTETAIASQAEPLSSPTIEQQKPAFSPRFKSTSIPKAEPSIDDSQGAQPVSKPGFKPRNIPAQTSEENPESQANTPAEESKPVTKPAFRPRNIPVKPTDPRIEEAAVERKPEITDSPKPPGFKPRNIRPPAEQNAVDTTKVESRLGQASVSETPVVDQQKQDEDIKQGYKPRFRMKNTPQNPAAGQEQTGQPAKQDLGSDTAPSTQHDKYLPGDESQVERNISSSTENKTPEQEIQDNNLDLRGNDDTDTEDKPKPAYKPKFNLKNIKKQNPEE